MLDGHGVLPSEQIVQRIFEIIDNYIERNSSVELFDLSDSLEESKEEANGDSLDRGLHLSDAKVKKLIGVHCTHGVNRTGYIICRYMIERLGIDPQAAVSHFEVARGHQLDREEYKENLYRLRPGCDQNAIDFHSRQAIIVSGTRDLSPGPEKNEAMYSSRSKREVEADYVGNGSESPKRKKMRHRHREHRGEERTPPPPSPPPYATMNDGLDGTAGSLDGRSRKHHHHRYEAAASSDYAIWPPQPEVDDQGLSPQHRKELSRSSRRRTRDAASPDGYPSGHGGEHHAGEPYQDEAYLGGLGLGSDHHHTSVERSASGIHHRSLSPPSSSHKRYSSSRYESYRHYEEHHQPTEDDLLLAQSSAGAPVGSPSREEREHRKHRSRGSEHGSRDLSPYPPESHHHRSSRHRSSRRDGSRDRVEYAAAVDEWPPQFSPERRSGSRSPLGVGEAGASGSRLGGWADQYDHSSLYASYDPEKFGDASSESSRYASLYWSQSAEGEYLPSASSSHRHGGDYRRGIDDERYQKRVSSSRYHSRSPSRRVSSRDLGDEARSSRYGSSRYSGQYPDSTGYYGHNTGRYGGDYKGGRGMHHHMPDRRPYYNNHPGQQHHRRGGFSRAPPRPRGGGNPYIWVNPALRAAQAAAAAADNDHDKSGDDNSVVSGTADAQSAAPASGGAGSGANCADDDAVVSEAS